MILLAGNVFDSLVQVLFVLHYLKPPAEHWLLIFGRFSNFGFSLFGISSGKSMTGHTSLFPFISSNQAVSSHPVSFQSVKFWILR